MWPSFGGVRYKIQTLIKIRARVSTSYKNNPCILTASGFVVDPTNMTTAVARIQLINSEELEEPWSMYTLHHTDTMDKRDKFGKRLNKLTN